mmetsp:Transcript_14136/g.42134  ORF Transcript_14136/g.42134 Transcript_14136/m.42134 type:complete len:264 (+) Transcript_14136:157-948(+)
MASMVASAQDTPPPRTSKTHHRRRASSPSYGSNTVSSTLKRCRGDSRPPTCVEYDCGVFSLPQLLDEALCRATVAEVDGRVWNGLSTTRGAALPTADVYVRHLRGAPRLHQAIDAGLHLIERCTGRLVDSKKEEAFVITYDARGQRGLGRHTDGEGKHTLLLTLDGPADYAGGGTRFFPGGREPFLIRPGRGGGLAFGGSVEHQGAAITAGRRHVLVVFAEDVRGAGAREVRAAQKRAARAVFAGDRRGPNVERLAHRGPHIV